MLAALALPLLAAAPAERRYSVTDFDRLLVDGPYEVVLKTGTAPSASANAARPGDLDALLVEVQGRELKVRAKPGRRADGVRLEITTHNLRNVSLSGPAQVSVDRMRSQRVALLVSGSGGLAVDRVESDALTLGVAGAGTMRVGGTAKTLKATVMGTGGLDAGRLTADHADIIAETAGQVTLAARTTAKVRSAGSGETIVTGSAACTIEQRGRGQVRCGR